MMSKKCILIGSSEAGKTTLAENLTYGSSSAKKTQMVQHISKFIDTPGEFLENPSFYRALLVSSYDADIIILVQEATEEKSIFPPNFSSAFNKKVIGVVTKTDLEKNTERAREHLKRAGAHEIYEVNKFDESSWELLRKYLNQI